MDDTELYHFLKLGEQSKEHKYIERVNVGSKSKPKYLYFYTQSAYQKYLRNKQRSENRQNNVNANNKKPFSFNNVSSRFNFTRPSATAFGKTKNAVSNVKNMASKTSNKVKDAVSKTSNNTKNVVEKTSNKVKNAVSKTSNNAKNAVEKTYKNVKNAVSKTANNAKNAVEKTTKNVKTATSKAKNTVEQKILDGKKYINERLTKTSNNSKNVLDGKKYVEKNTELLSRPSKKITESAYINKKTLEKITKDSIDSSKKKQDISNLKMSGINYYDIAAKHPGLTNVLAKKSKHTTDIEDRKAINPFYGTDGGFDENSYSCAIAYDLRRRGFDVTSISSNVMGRIDIETIAKCYDNSELKYAELYDSESEEEFTERFKNILLEESNGEDSYGVLMFDSRGRNEGTINYEIKNGEVKYIDTQYPIDENLYEYDGSTYLDEYMDFNDYKGFNGRYKKVEQGITFMRTDNLCPNENITLFVSNKDEPFIEVKDIEAHGVYLEDFDIDDSVLTDINGEIKAYEDQIHVLERVVTMYEEGKIEVKRDKLQLPIPNGGITINDIKESLSAVQTEYEEIKNEYQDQLNNMYEQAR